MRRLLHALATLSVLSALLAFASLPARAATRAISVTELNYNPRESSDFEFIELINTSGGNLTLTGAKFTNAIEYTFGVLVLQPNQRVVVCANRAKFTDRYGAIAQLAASSFKGNFKDSGEVVTLVDASNKLLLSFEYDSSGTWPSRANGLGSTLEVIDPLGDLNDPDNWRSSAEYDGSPGRAGIGPQRSVVINEVLAHTDPPLEDAIELYNNLDTAVDISGWFISNERSEPFKFQIPAGTIIKPHGFKVIYEYQFNNAASTNAFTFNSAHGDEAVLLSNGTPMIWMDATSFDASENGYSFARYPNGTGPLVIQSDLSFGTDVRNFYPQSFLGIFRTGLGASNNPPRVGPLVISQIQYDPPAGEDEFIEILNPTAQSIPLYDPNSPTNRWKLEDAVTFEFPANVTLAAGAKLIVCSTNPAAFRARQPVPDTVQVFGPWTGLLNNAGDHIKLYKPDPPQLPPRPDAGFVPYILVEEINYTDTAPWPVGGSNGFSILRKTLNYANDGSNWYTDSVAPPTVSVNAALVGANIRLRFNVPAGYTATIETRRDAGSGAWSPAQSFAAQASDRTQDWLYVVEGVQRTFRVSISR